MLVAAWIAVTTKTDVNYFGEYKILSWSRKVSTAEDSDPFMKFEKEIENLHSLQPDLVSENMDAAFFTRVDGEVLVVQPPPSDVEIVVELLEAEDVSNDNDDTIETEDDPVYYPDSNELLQIIKTMQKFSLFSKDSAVVQSYVNHVAGIIDKNSTEKSRQKRIRYFFSNFVKKCF